jgi:transposase
MGDNSSIHKNREVREAMKELNLKILTICPYSASLNPCEKLILAIRKKVKFEVNKNVSESSPETKNLGSQ